MVAGSAGPRVDYGNLKSAVAARQGGSRTGVYGNAWGVLRELEAR